ncbi:MAG: hypothetical protein KBC96_14315 [Armatimonadetes bacterium]|nr:hypothetical protein [Armatimonadota bacterium]
MNRAATIALVWTCLAPLAGGAASSAPQADANCLMCHSSGKIAKETAGKKSSLYVDALPMAESAHAKLKCVECHADLPDRPQMHAKDVASVQCANCHDLRSSHPDAIHIGMKSDKAAPACRDCHGSHDIRPVKDPLSRVNRASSTGVCAACHADLKSLQSYRFGVHGAVAKLGEMPAAVCTDCHKVHHPKALGRSVDCMGCHEAQAEAYTAGSHGIARIGGDPNAPDCVDCHGGHDLLRKDDRTAGTHRLNEPRMCGKCHNDGKLMREYDLPGDSLRTYLHSYHGKANLHESEKAAVCSDCHGAHKVLPSSDPASMTNPSNLDKTCGECHPGVNTKVAQGQTHVRIAKESSPLLYYIANGFKWLTIITMVMLCGHIMLDLFSRLRRRITALLRRGS